MAHGLRWSSSLARRMASGDGERFQGVPDVYSMCFAPVCRCRDRNRHSCPGPWRLPACLDLSGSPCVDLPTGAFFSTGVDVSAGILLSTSVDLCSQLG